MASSGRFTPLSMEREARAHVGQDTAADIASYARGAAPLQSSTTRLVESSREETPYGDVSPAAANPNTSTTKHNGDAAEPHPQSNATADAEPTTENVENRIPHTSRNCQNPSHRRSWRSLPWVQKLGLWILGHEVENTLEDFCRDVRLTYTVDNNDIPVDTSAMFDTFCPGDFISASFVKDVWHEDYSGKPKRCVAYWGGPLYSFGQIELRWSSRDNRPNWWPGRLSFKPKTYRTSFEVIDTEDFDLAIGKVSLAKHKLVTVNNRHFGLFKANRPANRKVTPSQAAQSQARADEERAEARRLRLQAEEQSQAQASTATATAATNG